MTESDRWLKGNEAHLSASLSWLRLRCSQLLQQTEEGGALQASASPAPVNVPWWKFAPSAPASDTPGSQVTKEDPAQLQLRLTQADQAAAMAAQGMEVPPALAQLSQRFGLSTFEQQVLLLCAAMELDPQIPHFCAHLHGDPAKAHPTFALALALFEDPAWDALSPSRPLRYWKLLEIHQPGALPLSASPLRLDERIVNYIKGLNHLDDRLALFLEPLASGLQGELPPSHQDQVDHLVGLLKQAESDELRPVVQLIGPHAASQRNLAIQVAADLGLSLYRLSAELLPTLPADVDNLLRLWQRETRLLPMGLLVDATNKEAPGLGLFLERCKSLCFVASREALHLHGSLQVDVQKPTSAEQRSAWMRALGPDAVEVSSRLAGQFSLGLQEIQQIASAGLAVPPEDRSQHLWQGCLRVTQPQLDALAQRLPPLATWDDLVLPETEFGLLRQIAAQVAHRMHVYEEGGFGARMNRGLGISALFAGESGTGKTMAAEVIANSLGLNLYRIDLSAVVSKYIGETEKNLRKLFDAAEDGGAILFFDEADALFGKRSEVKDSHDRYANIEINYLLQRIEAYQGLAILATNMKASLDSAFMRRLRFVVNLPFPGTTERRLIWEKSFPPKTQTRDLDFNRLARFNLTGGNIHTIALNSAFLAAEDRQPVGMAHVLRAVRTEFHKLERPFNEYEFRLTPVAAGGGAP